MARDGITALQHRGQESAGIAHLVKGRITIRGGLGLVNQVFPEPQRSVVASAAIAHTRYSTVGSGIAANVQPMALRHPSLGYAALAHNGNFTNAPTLRAELELAGAVFTASVDTEVLARLLERTDGEDWMHVMAGALARMEGAYSLILLTSDGVIAARDPLGFRPLVLGRTAARVIAASETCAIEATGARVVRDVHPGELVLLSPVGMTSLRVARPERSALCLFELIYFAHHASVLCSGVVSEARTRTGCQLAREAPAAADVVVGVPDSGIHAAAGFADFSGLPLTPALLRLPGVDRTFILPTQSQRVAAVDAKFMVRTGAVAGKRVVLVDDSVVRGTTARRAIALLRQHGAVQVHLRIASPPIRNPCFMGVDIGTRRELVAGSKTVSDVGASLGADTIGYLSLEGLLASTPLRGRAEYCHACFTGRYPLSVDLSAAPVKHQFEARRVAGGSPSSQSLD